MRITNQDSAGCPITTFGLSRSDSSANFTSSITTAVDLAAQANTIVGLSVTEVSATSGQSTTTTVTASATGHPNGSANVATNYLPVPCTQNPATVSLTPPSQTITVAGASAFYTVSITNNDTAACAPRARTFTSGDSNTTEFNVSSLCAQASSTVLAPGASTKISNCLAVNAKLIATSGTNITSVTESGVINADPPGPPCVTTTISLTGSSGPNNPGSGAASGTGTAWHNPGNVLASDDLCPAGKPVLRDVFLAV